MKRNYIDSICRKLVAETLKVEESKISVVTWGRIIYDFTTKAILENWSMSIIQLKFQDYVGEILAKQHEVREFWLATLQHHHDYYVFCYRKDNGELDDQDMAQYDLAMQREKDGLCKRLRDDAVSPYD